MGLHAVAIGFSSKAESFALNFGALKAWEDPVYPGRQWQSDDAEYEVAKRQTGGLIGMVVILLLLIAGLFLIQQLHTSAAIEDCLMSGRRNCDASVHNTTQAQPEP